MTTTPSTEHAKSLDELFEEVTATHGQALRRLCKGYELNAERRKDLYQEILLQIWRALPTFNHDSSLRTWMFRVAHNISITYVSREKRIPSTAQLNDELLSGGKLPDGELERSEKLNKLQSAIAQLRPMDRQIILLYLEEIPQSDIGEIVGISRDNVSTRISRIKTQLAETTRGDGHA